MNRYMNFDYSIGCSVRHSVSNSVGNQLEEGIRRFVLYPNMKFAVNAPLHGHFEDFMHRTIRTHIYDTIDDLNYG